MTKFIYEKFLPRTHLDGIIISARWKSDDIQAAIKTAQALHSYADRVFIFGPIVEYDQALPRILVRAIVSNKSESKFAEMHRLVAQKEIDRTFSAALQGGSVEYVSVYRAICDPAVRFGPPGTCHSNSTMGTLPVRDRSNWQGRWGLNSSRIALRPLHSEICGNLGDDGLRKAAYLGWRPNRP